MADRLITAMASDKFIRFLRRLAPVSMIAQQAYSKPSAIPGQFKWLHFIGLRASRLSDMG